MRAAAVVTCGRPAQGGQRRGPSNAGPTSSRLNQKSSRQQGDVVLGTKVGHAVLGAPVEQGVLNLLSVCV